MKNDTRRIMNFLDSMDWFFGIQNFEKSITVEKEDRKFDDNYQFNASIIFEERYQRVSVTIYPNFFKHCLSDQRKMLLHELCHSFTIAGKKLLHDFLDGKFVTPQEIHSTNEKMTSQIENVLDKLLKGGGRYALKAYKEYIRNNSKFIKKNSKHIKPTKKVATKKVVIVKKKGGKK